MAVDTGIEGSPGSIRAVADWLRGTLGPAVAGGGDALAAARRAAVADWRGETGEAFCGAMSRAATAADRVDDGVARARVALDDYAETLQRCQARMAGLREEARAAGLAVAGATIHEPAAGPPAADPGAAADGRHQELLRAYTDLRGRAEEVRQDLERARERVAATDRALDGPDWAVNLAGIAGGLAGAALDLHGSILRDGARYFGDLAAANLARLGGRGRVPSAARFYGDLDHYARMGAGAADDAARGARFLRLGRTVSLGGGALLTGVGIVYDLERGEGAGQAVTSNVGGLAASVAAGAAVGTVIGGPVGTVAGVVVGAGVGVFTSGMVDGLWDSGGDLGAAVVAGADTLADTGGALLDGASEVGGAVVDGIGGLFD